MKIKILFFGISKDITKENSLLVDLDQDATIHTMSQMLMAKYPDFSSFNDFSIALNEEYVKSDAILKENDIVAIIPPVSGG